MNNCKDCRYFQLPKINVRNPEFGKCSRFTSEVGDPRQEDAKAFAQDFENYEAWLRARPDFGCVEWQEAPRGRMSNIPQIGAQGPEPIMPIEPIPLYLIEARTRKPADKQQDEWEPVSLSLDRKFHYASLESAREAIRKLLNAEQALPHLVFRLATGKPKLDELLEFRIVEVRTVKATE